MPTPTVITDLSQTAASNYPAGTDSPSVLDDVQRAHAAFIALLRDSKGLTAVKTLASGTTTDIGGENSYAVEVTGTTTITSFGTNYNGPRHLRFTGILTLTHNATLLNLPGAANIVTAVGDTALVTPNSTGNGWNVVGYMRTSGLALHPSDYLNTTRIDVASAATVDLTANAPNTRHINITGTTGITAFTVAIGQTYFVRFNAALTLTNGASLVTQTGANIATAAGDTCILRATAANTVEVLSYIGPSTDTQPGRVELATNAETQTGTDATRAVTPSGLANASLGLNQTWQNVTGSRTPGTTYTNNTGRPISVSAYYGPVTTDSVFYTTLTISGIVVMANGGGRSGAGANGYSGVSGIVPNGATYTVNGYVTVWAELR